MLTFATVAPICLTFIWRFQPHVAQVPDILRLHNTAVTVTLRLENAAENAAGNGGQSKSNAVHHLIALVVANRWGNIDGNARQRVLQRHANVAGNMMRQHVADCQIGA